MAAGAGSVGLAAVLLGSIAFLAWRIERQAMETEEALDGIRDNTGMFFDLANVNASLERMIGSLRTMRTEGEA
jgi:hypothetical protein